MVKKTILFALILLACYFPIFLHLDSLSLFQYDESRLAMNAWEMLDSGDLLVSTFHGKPDMWNTKPPLMIWLQALSMKILGVNELSVRLPSALSALLTILFIGFYCWRFLKSLSLGLFAMLVLLTTPGYIATHVSRTGDYDALLILFLVLFLLTCFRLATSNDGAKKNKLLLSSALWLSLAVLTKSVAGLFFIPIVAIYFTLKKTWPFILSTKYLLYSIGLFLLLVGGYYGIREMYTPGYLEAVWQNELGGRYLAVLEDHGAPFGYYFKNIWAGKFMPWIFFLPLAIFIGWHSEKRTKAFLQFLLLSILGFLLIISSSQSKLEWYDAPIYPLLAIVIAIGIESIYQSFRKLVPRYQSFGLLLFCIAIFAMPYKEMVSKVYLPVHKNPLERYTQFIKRTPQYKSFTVPDSAYSAPIAFYERLYDERGYDIERKALADLSEKEQVMVCGVEQQFVLGSLFEYDVIKEWKDCMLVVLVRERE